MASSGKFFPCVGVNLGSAGTFAGFNEQTLNISGPSPWLGQLGQVFEEDAKCYRLVQFDNGAGNVASVAGGAAHWKTRASFIVTSDQSDAEAGVNGVAGAFLGVLTDQYYGFVQMGGVQAVVTDTTAAAGTLLVGTTTDLTLYTTQATTTRPYAVSYGTNTTTSANAYWILGSML